MLVGAVVRLKNLATRPDLNGVHATVVAPADASEATELIAKERVKVTTALVDETLAVRHTSAEPMSAVQHAIFSTENFVIDEQPGRGYTWRARRRMRPGKQLFREEPLVVTEYAAHLTDPVVQSLQAQLEPFVHLNKGEYTFEAEALLDQSMERMATIEFEKAMSRDKRRWMALSDAFAVDDKTPASIMKTNSFKHDAVMCQCMYEHISRLNHTCEPNLTTHFDGFALIVSTLRDVAEGDELSICYARSAMREPTVRRRAILKASHNFVCMCDRCRTMEPGLKEGDRAIDRVF